MECRNLKKYTALAIRRIDYHPATFAQLRWQVRNRKGRLILWLKYKLAFDIPLDCKSRSRILRPVWRHY
jgi:hypothetical protein